MNNRLKFTILILIMSVLAACDTKKSVVLQEGPCSPPCWNAITPGVSQKQDVEQILASLPAIDSDSIRTVSQEMMNDSIYWNFKPEIGDMGGIIRFYTDTVSVIELFPKRETITVSAAVDVFGEPEKILAIKSMGERARLIVYLIYPSRGILLTYTNDPFRENERAEVSKNQTIDSIWYFDPPFPEAVVTQLLYPLDPSVFQQGLREWNGYGEIDFVIDR